MSPIVSIIRCLTPAACFGGCANSQNDDTDSDADGSLRGAIGVFTEMSGSAARFRPIHFSLYDGVLEVLIIISSDYLTFIFCHIMTFFESHH